MTWREGGRRDAKRQSWTFTDKKQAAKFRAAVDLAGQKLPPQYAEPEPEPDALTLEQWSRRWVDARTGIEERTRHD